MKRVALPTHYYLASLFTYHETTGELYWAERPVDAFNSKAEWLKWTEAFAGKSAITVEKRNGKETACVYLEPDWCVNAARVIWKMLFSDEVFRIKFKDNNPLNLSLTNLDYDKVLYSDDLQSRTEYKAARIVASNAKKKERRTERRIKAGQDKAEELRLRKGPVLYDALTGKYHARFMDQKYQPVIISQHDNEQDAQKAVDQFYNWVKDELAKYQNFKG